MICFRLLELASHNNVLLLEKLKEQEEKGGKRTREAEEQVARFPQFSFIYLHHCFR